MNVHVTIDGLYEFWAANIRALIKNYLPIATDHENGTVIFLTEEDGFPFFLVEIDGESRFEASTSSWSEAEAVYEKILEMYDYSNRYEPAEPDVEELFDEDDLDRLNEIDTAAVSFLTSLFGCDPAECSIGSAEIDAMVRNVEQFLYENYLVSIHHPTIMDAGEGVIVVQYPYTYLDDC